MDENGTESPTLQEAHISFLSYLLFSQYFQQTTTNSFQEILSIQIRPIFYLNSGNLGLLLEL